MYMQALLGQLRACQGHHCLLQVGGSSGLVPLSALTFGTPGKVFCVSVHLKLVRDCHVSRRKLVSRVTEHTDSKRPDLVGQATLGSKDCRRPQGRACKLEFKMSSGNCFTPSERCP